MIMGVKVTLIGEMNRANGSRTVSPECHCQPSGNRENNQKSYRGWGGNPKGEQYERLKERNQKLIV